MARGDSIFGRVDVDWHTGEKTSQLTPTQRDIYLNGLWLQAVKIRRDVIPPHLCRCQTIAKLLTSSFNTVKRTISKCESLGLITINPDKSIKVHGVKEIHKPINWKTTPYTLPKRGTSLSPNVPQTFPHEDIDRREEEEESYTISSNKPSSLLTPTPSSKEQEGVHKSGRTPEKNPDRHQTKIDPDSIISDIEIIHKLTNEIISDLTLPDELAPEISELIAHHPASWITEARSATLDKIHAVNEGKSQFTKGPLEYFAGILDRRRSAE